MAKQESIEDVIRARVRKEVKRYFREPDVWMESYLRATMQRLVREGAIKLPTTPKKKPRSKRDS